MGQQYGIKEYINIRTSLHNIPVLYKQLNLFNTIVSW